MMQRFLFLLVLLFSSSVFAETVEATFGTVSARTWYRSPGSVYYTTTAGLCASHVPQNGASPYAFIRTQADPTTHSEITVGTCTTSNNSVTVLAWVNCPSGTTAGAGYTCVTTSLVCPDSSWTLSGSTCSRSECPPGETRNTAAPFNCQADCSSKAGPTNPKWCLIAGASAASCSGEIGGCGFKCNTVTFNSGPQGQESVQLYPRSGYGSNCRFTGQPASPTESDNGGSEMSEDDIQDFYQKKTSNPTPSKCAAMGSDYVQLSSGAKVCMDGPTTGVPAPNVSTGSEKTTSTTPNTNEPTKTTEETKSTNCTGPNCTTTTTTGTPPDTAANGTANAGCAPGATLVNGKCETTSSTTQDRGDYCTKNPNDAACKSPGECDKNPDSVACMKAGTPENIPEPTPKAFSMSNIIAVNLPGNNSCPSNVALPYGAEFSYDKICEGLSMIRPLLIVLAWISAAFIVFGGKKES